MRVALIHDWLTGMRGGEKCLEAFCELFPEADLYTLIYLPDKVSETIRAMRTRTSWITRLPGIERYYRYCLPLFPSAIERFNLAGYDLVLSSSHCVAKGAFPERALHIAYIHSPMRYVWDMYEVYFGRDISFLARAGMALSRKRLQRWDVDSAGRVRFFVANSKNVARKIGKLYNREATVIHPPVQVERFSVSEEQESYYLIVSALVPYKRIDIAIEAFNKLKLPLKIAGDGPLRKKLEDIAEPNVEFLGWVGSDQLPGLYASCQALVLPGEEDFGIVPLEAQASGRPVIAYGRGGALETVVALDSGGEPDRSCPQPSGIFFRESSPESLAEAVRTFQKTKHRFDAVAIRRHASRFSRDRFKIEVRDFIEARLRDRRSET